MNPTMIKEQTDKKITGLFFDLHQLESNNPGGFEWEIRQIQITNGKITEVKISPASVKEVTANRLATILQNNETVESLA
jgi:hypothetical protein